MATVEISSGQLFYELLGQEGDPVVLVHGSWVDHRTWNLVMPLMSGAMRVLAYDRRGHGASTGESRRHPLADDSKDLAEMLVAVDHYPVHVIGHSYGATVALRLATDRPELVRSLVLHEPALIGLLDDDPGAQLEAARLRADVVQLRTWIARGRVEEAARAFVNAFGGDAGAWDRLAPEWRRTFLRNAPRWSEEFSDPATERPDLSALSEFMSPVLLTEGALSPPFLHRISSALGGHLKNSHSVRLPDVGHFPHLTHPAQYVGVLHRFLVERDVPAM